MAERELDSELSWIDAHMKEWVRKTTPEERRQWIEEAEQQVSDQMEEILSLPDEPCGDSWTQVFEVGPHFFVEAANLGVFERSCLWQVDTAPEPRIPVTSEDVASTMEATEMAA